MFKRDHACNDSREKEVESFGSDTVGSRDSIGYIYIS